jgi:hypothetical protein
MILNEKKQDDAGQREFGRLVEELYELYLGSPNLALHEKEIKKILVTETQINQLVKGGCLIKEPYAKDGRTEYYYMLGANFLNLVTNLRIEKLNKILVKLNAILLALTLWVAGTGVVEVLYKINSFSPSFFGIFLLIWSALCLFLLMKIHFGYR